MLHLRSLDEHEVKPDIMTNTKKTIGKHTRNTAPKKIETTKRYSWEKQRAACLWRESIIESQLQHTSQC